MSVSRELVDLVEKDQRVHRPGRRYRLDDPAGHGTDIGLSVTPYVRFVAHAAEGVIILSEEHVDMVDAALGTEVEVETVDGKMIMKVPAGTQSGTPFKLSGHGVPFRADGDRGPHIVTIIVDTPKKLSKKQRELLEEFQKTKKKGLFR